MLDHLAVEDDRDRQEQGDPEAPAEQIDVSGMIDRVSRVRVMLGMRGVKRLLGGCHLPGVGSRRGMGLVGHGVFPVRSVRLARLRVAAVMTSRIRRAVTGTNLPLVPRARRWVECMIVRRVIHRLIHELSGQRGVSRVARPHSPCQPTEDSAG